MATNTIHPKLIPFLFPYAPDNWECTKNFYIDGKTCIIIQDETKQKTVITNVKDLDLQEKQDVETKVGKKDDEVVKNEKEELSSMLLFNDLVQFKEVPFHLEFLNPSHDVLNTEKNIEETFKGFASTCLEEYNSLVKKFPGIKF